MSYLTKVQSFLKESFSTKSVPFPGKLQGDARFWQSLRSVIMASQSEVTMPYSQSIWVYSSIKAIADNISTTPFRLYTESKKRSGPNAANVVIEKGPEYDLFMNPNPFMSTTELVESTLIYMGLSGEAFWVLDRENVTELPKSIWSVNPANMSPIIDETTGYLLGWRYGKDSVFTFAEIIHFKYFNPYDPYRGLSPLMAAKMGIDQDFLSSVYNKNFFKNGAIVSGFIEVEDELSDPAFQRLLNQFEDRHSGAGKAHKIGLLEGGAKFKEAKLSQKDMDFISGKKMTREEIFAAYKTNSVVLGLYEDVKSYEGVVTAHRAFWHECLIPKTVYIEEIAWSRLFSKINGGKIWGEFDLANVASLLDDFDRKTVTATRLFQMGYPINEINRRLDLGMSHMQYGDTAFVGTNVTPVTPALINGELQVNPNKPKPADGQNKPDKTPPNTDKPAPKPKKDGLESFDNIIAMVKALELKSTDIDSIKQQYSDILVPIEEKFHSKMKRFLFEQRKRVLASINEKENIQTDSLFVDKEELAALRKLFDGPYGEGIRAGAEMLRDELAVTDFSYDPSDPAYFGYAIMRMTKVPNEILSSIKNVLRKTIMEGIDKKESKSELTSRVRAAYNTLSARIGVIAKTESVAVVNAGRFLTMQKLHIREHQWVTLNYDSARDSHKALNGSIARVGDYFKMEDGSFSKLRFPCDLKAPANEIINCFCITIPIKNK